MLRVFDFYNCYLTCDVSLCVSLFNSKVTLSHHSAEFVDKQKLDLKISLQLSLICATSGMQFEKSSQFYLLNFEYNSSLLSRYLFFSPLFLIK